MKENAWERAVRLGEYIAESKDTVRKAAAKFGISKSTVHKDVTKRNEKSGTEQANSLFCPIFVVICSFYLPKRLPYAVVFVSIKVLSVFRFA